MFENKQKYATVIYTMIAFLFIFQIIDVVATQSAMKYGIVEKNPIAKNIIDNHNNPFLRLLIYKISTILGMAFAFKWWLKKNVFEIKRHKEVVFGVTFIVTLLSSIVLFFHTWNFIIIQSLS